MKEDLNIALRDTSDCRFGGIDILINNASAISLTSTLDTDMKRYDLMHSINTRGTFLMSDHSLSLFFFVLCYFCPVHHLLPL